MHLPEGSKFNSQHTQNFLHIITPQKKFIELFLQETHKLCHFSNDTRRKYKCKYDETRMMRVYNKGKEKIQECVVKAD